VSHGIGAFDVGDIDHMFGNQRTRDGGAEHIAALVQRTGFEQLEQILAGEFFGQVFDVNFARAGGFGFFRQPGELFTLADIGGEADHLAAVILFQPGDNHGRIQPAGVGQDDFLDLIFGCILGHNVFSLVFLMGKIKKALQVGGLGCPCLRFLGVD
jgi:hypothetical protein